MPENQHRYDVAVIGGGPAGLAAAIAAKKQGAKKVLIIERDFCLGGILQQCIHLGFGLKYFQTELSGPEYAGRFIKEASQLGIETLLNTMVLSIDSEQKIIYATNSTKGSFGIECGAIILAMGCRERTRAALSIPGTRPAGIYTAGTAQRFINVQNAVVGKNVVILGSGDIGMIMARRLTLEGVKVEAVVEIMPYLAGLTRNKVQCLDDFDIPLYLNHTITNIQGIGRVSGVTVSKVDECMRPIPSEQWDIPCDTVLLSVGLIPENELSKSCGVELHPVTKGPIVNNRMETNINGIFACGNVVHVNDLVDNVSIESEIAGTYAALHSIEQKSSQSNVKKINVSAGEGVRYVVPTTIDTSDNAVKDIKVYFRVEKPIRDAYILTQVDGTVVTKKKTIKVNPGEMESVSLKLDNLKELNVSNVEVSVCEAEVSK